LSIICGSGLLKDVKSGWELLKSSSSMAFAIIVLWLYRRRMIASVSFVRR
jgi:hypothetical protein